MSELYDVAVIGAGPAGSLCATLTARAGLSTLLLEEHEAPGLFVRETTISVGMFTSVRSVRALL
jgi:flavin-dependent dehydrogenase